MLLYVLKIVELVVENPFDKKKAKAGGKRKRLRWRHCSHESNAELAENNADAKSNERRAEAAGWDFEAVSARWSRTE